MAIEINWPILEKSGPRIKLAQIGENFVPELRGSTTQNRLIFQLCFIMLKIKLYVCRILCENFIQIWQKIKKL